MTTVNDPLAKAVSDFASLGKIHQRKMFGGVYIYCNDLFIATVHDGKLYFKANVNTAPDFIAKGLSIFSYPRQGTTATLQYYQAPAEVFSDQKAMHFWAKKALLAATQDASAKTKKSAKPSVTSKVRTT